MELLPQVLLLLGLAVFVIVVFHRLHIPSTIGYLLVGVILGPGTVGPVVERAQIATLAEFGIVFLLFTVGLSYSLPELGALQRRVPALGTAQVVLTTAVVSVAAWAVGLAPAAAFVIGAVFAQSSTTIIAKQLAEQGEENSRSGRLGLAMSVFQDVTAVPFIVIIPVLGAAAGAGVLAGELGTAVAKAVLAVALVLLTGRWLLKPLFHLVARLRSTEVFTLTVLFVVLVAAWTTHSLGLSLAFGAFLAGMALGESEFRHQVEASIKPFRDVLLGLFFVAIGMLVEPAALTGAWHWALLGATFLVLSKATIVFLLARVAGLDRVTAARMGLILAVGGEFGLALLAIAVTTGTISDEVSQIGFTSVLLSMLIGTFLIRHSRALAGAFGRVALDPGHDRDALSLGTGSDPAPGRTDHVIIGGYGRIGQSVAHFLESENIPYVAVDLDAVRVREARAAGEPVFYGDLGEPQILKGLGVDRARLVLVGHDDTNSALRTLAYLRARRPDLPVVVRTRDVAHVDELHAAGAFEVVAEKLEAGLSIASQVLLLLDTPVSQVMERVRQQRARHYPLMQEYFTGNDVTVTPDADEQRTRVILVPEQSTAVGHLVEELGHEGATVAALLRAGERIATPGPGTQLLAEDVLVLRGPLDVLERVEDRILKGSSWGRRDLP